MMQPVVFDPAGLRVGQGYDVHAFAEGRKLILGGVDVPHVRGLLGHSDADVLAHAISDALLGGIRGGDIGKLFPDTDPAFKDADSLKLLAAVADKVRAEGIPGVFTIELSNGKLADTICEATGAKKLEFATCHNVTAQAFANGATYLQLMERNVQALREALN